MRKTLNLLSHNKFVVTFFSLHVLFAIFLGRLFALAPDEGGYLYTFNNLYGGRDANPQYNSGWITAPKPFLWTSYLPSKILDIFGTPDYLAIRLLSIILVTFAVVLLINMQRNAAIQGIGNRNLIFAFFLIPSVFLWTSVGLRESFIILEFTLLASGVSHFFGDQRKLGLLYLFLGSYGLMATKNYLWVCMIAAALLAVASLALRLNPKRQLLSFFSALILIPCLVFAATTSTYALKFFLLSVFHTDVASVGMRSGDSVIQIAIPKGQIGSIDDGSTDDTGGSGSIRGPLSGLDGPTLITFHGDTTLILIHFYFQDHPNSLFTKVLGAIGIKSKLDEIWVAKIKSGLIKKSEAALPDSSSLSGYILKPASVHNPMSVFRPAFLFLFGPIPFLDQGGLALNTVSFESPIWWLLYLIVGIGLVRYGRKRIIKDPVLLFAGVLFLALVTFSALVEVNLGTSFRHRSIILVPLLVMYIRTRSRPPVLAD